MERKYDVKPSNYSLDFLVDLKKSKFDGAAVITAHAVKPVKLVTLNAADLKISKCRVIVDGKDIAKKFKLDKEKEELVISLKERGANGEMRIELGFSAPLNESLTGFYKSTYLDTKGKKKYLASTDFEPADARRMFPCFDEPAQKATFDVSITTDKNLAVVSNTLPLNEESVGKSLKKTVFHTTPPMSTYLFYVGVGDFEFLEGKHKDCIVRIVTTPGKKKNAAFALDCTIKFLKYYEDYFGTPYPLPKLDLLAIPDFKSGAMENWGAITFREVYLLYDPETSSKVGKQSVADTIAHELAHQWFGNLVTMKWWNDLWLNESFATFMAYKAVDHYYPEWEYWSGWLEEQVAGAFGLDALKTSHPINVEVEHPQDVAEIFDAISYNKGGSVLRMLESYLGEEKFAEGLKLYISRHAYSNTVTTDLWNALEEVSREPVKEIMSDWTGQTGYPMISAELKGSKLELSQERFYLEKPSKPDHAKWIVPLVTSIDGLEKSIRLDERSKTIELSQPFKAIKLNAGQKGFYKARYSKELLDALKDGVKSKKLSVHDRWGVQADVFSLAKSSQTTLKEYFNLSTYYGNEEDYLVASEVLGRLFGSYDFLDEGKSRAEAGILARKFARKQLERLGWDAKPGEKENDSQLRGSALWVLGRIGEKDVLGEALERFKTFQKNRKTLSPDLRGVVYSLYAIQGGVKEYTLIRKLYESEKAPDEKMRFLGALGKFKDEKLLKETLNYALTPKVRAQDIHAPFGSVASNPVGEKLAWPWLKKNWKKLLKRFGKGDNVKILGRFIQHLGGLSDLETEKELRKFFKKPVRGTEKALSQTLERIRINHAFVKANP